MQVTVHATANHIHYLIEDNGIGRKLAATYKQQNKLAYGSMGMQITEERITLFNQHQNGAVTIEDPVSYTHLDVYKRQQYSRSCYQ